MNVSRDRAIAMKYGLISMDWIVYTFRDDTRFRSPETNSGRIQTVYVLEAQEKAMDRGLS